MTAVTPEQDTDSLEDLWEEKPPVCEMWPDYSCPGEVHWLIVRTTCLCSPKDRYSCNDCMLLFREAVRKAPRGIVCRICDTHADIEIVPL